jgi:hypothetical protein
VLASCATIVLGCASTGGLDERGYHNTTYPYAIAYHDAGAKQLLGPEWQLDNWSFDQSRQRWSLKKGDEYVGERTMDLDRNGTVSFDERAKEAIFDVKLVSRSTGAVIWAKAHPIHPDDADRKLEVLLHDYADSLRGNGLYAQGSVFNIERVVSRKFTTFETERKEGTLSGVPMIAATIELAEVDRLQVRPDERSAKLRIVMVKYPYVREWADANAFQKICPRNPTASAPASPPSGPPGSEPRPAGSHAPGVQRLCHTLLVLGYYNTPQHFAEELPAFEQMLKQVSISAAPASSRRPGQ